MDDASKRLLCASGGVGTCIAEFVVKEKNGVVFGTAYDVDMVPRVVAVERMEDIERLKGSKYVQSVVGNEMYSQIKAMLDMGRFVAFIGTPCQVAAVRRFLNKSYENFISVDLICHGVSPLSYFQGELKRIKAKVGDVDIATIRFRGNDEYNFKLSAWSPDGCRYVVDWNDSCYFAGFLWGVTLRESCYHCLYAKPERGSDLTIGDFIGLGCKTTFPYDVHNVSSVFVNSVTGEKFYREMSDCMSRESAYQSIQRDYGERLEYKPSLMEPFARHKLVEKFRRLYRKHGYQVAIEKTVGREIAMRNVKRFLCRGAKKMYAVARGLMPSLLLDARRVVR